MMTSAQVVETLVSVTTNSTSQDYTHPDNHNLPIYDNNKKSPRGVNPAVVLSPLVPSMAGTSTFNAPSNAMPIAPSSAIESLPAHRSADG